MSANGKKVLALMVSVLTSALMGLGWGVILRLLGEPVIECVKDGGAAGGGTLVACLAVIMLFPFKDDQLPPPQLPAPPRTPVP
ncbi:hypothetical protein [Streptomyces sp. NPDC095817]|uniref:hypothetical protein n=1 Tax=Streptomyces sp. NPDC095817 TaxID=3155082 RepID=UPI00331E0448